MQQRIKQNVVFYIAAILFALALKQHYSLAVAEDLDWILKPTAGLASLLSGARFTFETGMGYVCDTQKIIIAPACAGINFMLMAFGMAVFSGMHHMKNHPHRLLWLMGSLWTAYGLTIVVNTIRIIVSVYTFQTVIAGNGLAWDAVHRLEGVVIYFFFQYLFYSIIRRIIEKYAHYKTGRIPVTPAVASNRNIAIGKAVPAGLIPCVWYLAVTLAVPFLNNAVNKTDGRFYHHATMVLGCCLLTWLFIVGVILCGRSVRLFLRGGYRKHETQNPDC